jgi:hypothetical protein
MVKKVILITLFILFSGILIYGAVNRTTAKTGAESHAVAQQNGDGVQSAQGIDGERLYRNRAESSGNGQGGQRSGDGGQGSGRQGDWQENDHAEGYGPGAQGGGRGQGQQRYLAQSESREFVTIEGTVIQAPAAGIDMILETDQGTVQIGTGPGYLDQVGYVITDGEQLTVTGFWEAGEFKVSEITRQSDGASIALRDEFGRPMWSGAVRNGGRGAGRATG